MCSRKLATKTFSKVFEEFKQEELESAENTTEDTEVLSPRVIGAIEPAQHSRRVQKKKY